MSKCNLHEKGDNNKSNYSRTGLNMSFIICLLVSLWLICIDKCNGYKEPEVFVLLLHLLYFYNGDVSVFQVHIHMC